MIVSPLAFGSLIWSVSPDVNLSNNESYVSGSVIKFVTQVFLEGDSHSE